MDRLKRRLRSGLRPALWVATGVGAAFVFALGQFPDYTVAQARLSFAYSVVGSFGGVLLLYAGGWIKSSDEREGRRMNPVVVVMVAVTLVILAATECGVL